MKTIFPETYIMFLFSSYKKNNLMRLSSQWEIIDHNEIMDLFSYHDTRQLRRSHFR